MRALSSVETARHDDVAEDSSPGAPPDEVQSHTTLNRALTAVTPEEPAEDPAPFGTVQNADFPEQGDVSENPWDLSKIQPVEAEFDATRPAVTLSTIIADGHSTDASSGFGDSPESVETISPDPLIAAPLLPHEPTPREEAPGVPPGKPRNSIVRRLTPLVTPGSWLAAPESERAGETPPDVPPPDPEQRGRLMSSVLGAFGMGSDPAPDTEVPDPAEVPDVSLDPQHAPQTVALIPTPAPRDQDTRLGSLQSIESVFWQEELDKLIALLQAEIAHGHAGETPQERERFVRQQIALRMLYLIASRRVEALQAIPSLDANEQRFWTQFFWALANYFDEEGIPDREERATQTLNQLTEAVRLLAPQARLDVQTASFCQRINGFGDFDPYEQNHFQPGQAVLIYADIRNFESQLTPAGDYRTLLKSTIEVFERELEGPMVYHHELPKTEDLCRTRRHDYFHSYRIQLPGTLSRGPHVLRLTMRDELTGKSAWTTLNFLVQ